jgi:hypothetical protein
MTVQSTAICKFSNVGTNPSTNHYYFTVQPGTPYRLLLENTHPTWSFGDKIHVSGYPVYKYQESYIISPPYSGKVVGKNSYNGIMPEGGIELEVTEYWARID